MIKATGFRLTLIAPQAAANGALAAVKLASRSRTLLSFAGAVILLRVAGVSTVSAAGDKTDRLQAEIKAFGTYD